MAATPEQSLQAVVKWGETAVALKDFSDKYPTPSIVKITKGQYRNIGVAKSVSSELLLHSVVTGKKLLAEGIKLRDGKKAIASDHKFSLPFSYQGWFELLSEDGKSIRAITSVQDLAKVFPQSCLVRENIKGFIANEHGEFGMDRTRIVYAGEQLNLVGDVVIPVPSYKMLGFGGTKRRLLRCFDMKGDSVYLGFDQRGLFSPIAGQTNISGVHNIKGLLEKFRLPIMVRLVHGIIPTRLDRGNFTGVFRLVSVYSDETAFVCPLRTDAKMVPIATREPLKLVTAQNKQEVENTADYQLILQRCTKMVSSYMNSIHVLVQTPEGGPFLKPKEIEHAELVPSKVTPLPQIEEDSLFDEIDDIYQYVREGGNPPQPRARPSGHRNSTIELSKTPAQATDENYWEEPIYERIDKFQKIKREGVLITTGATVSAAIDQSYAVEATTAGDQNIDTTSSDGGVAIKEEAPPIPPKRFDDDSASQEFEEIEERNDTGSSRQLSPEILDTKDMSLSKSGSSTSPRRSPAEDDSLPRKVSSASLGKLISSSPPALPERDSQYKRHSMVSSTRNPADISDSSRRVIFRSPTEIVDSSGRVNLRKPVEKMGHGRVRSPSADFTEPARRFFRENSAPNLSPRHSSLDATHIVFNRDLKNAGSARGYTKSDHPGHRGPVTVSTNGHSVSVRSSPKYVAIARVGDPSPTKRTVNGHGSSSDENSMKLDKQPHIVSVSRRKVQSIFL